MVNFGGFFAKLGHFAGFLYVSIIRRKDQLSCDGWGDIIFFRVPCSSDRVQRSSEGCSVALRVPHSLDREQRSSVECIIAWGYSVSQ